MNIPVVHHKRQEKPHRELVHTRSGQRGCARVCRRANLDSCQPEGEAGGNSGGQKKTLGEGRRVAGHDGTGGWIIVEGELFVGGTGVGDGP